MHLHTRMSPANAVNVIPCIKDNIKTNMRASKKKKKHEDIHEQMSNFFVHGLVVSVVSDLNTAAVMITSRAKNV